MTRRSGDLHDLCFFAILTVRNEKQGGIKHMPAKKGNKHGAQALKKYWEKYDSSNNRTKYIPIKVSDAEFAEISDIAARQRLSRVELIVRAVLSYEYVLELEAAKNGE